MLSVSIWVATTPYVCQSCDPRLETRWQPKFTGNRGEANNNNVGGNLGIQLGDLTNSRAEFIDDALHLTNTAPGGNRPIRIHTNAATGAAFGWTVAKPECDAEVCLANEDGCIKECIAADCLEIEDGCAEECEVVICTFKPIEEAGFHAVEGTLYRVTYTLSLSQESEGSTARLQRRVGSENALISFNSPALTTTPQKVSMVFTHGDRGTAASINIDTGNIPDGI